MELILPHAPPLSLYVHFPWCVRKCPYCDFNSWTMGNDAPLEHYLDALLCDLEQEAKRAEGRKLISIFLGGGTPSVFPPAQIAALLEAVSTSFDLADDVEITMEANPGTVESSDPAAYRDAGVNRLSIGAQSFSSRALEALGRIHRVADIERTFNAARAGGFDNINLDLMYGLPGQDVDAAIADIDAAAALGPEHLSWYQLTLEPNTVFYARPPSGLPGEELAAAIQEQGQERLADHGYEQYEVSAYAHGGRKCRHNLNYWSFGDYLAVGAGAHGKVSSSSAVLRYAKPANPREYMATIGAGETGSDPRPVADDDLLFEYMLNVLRLNNDFGEADFALRTGLPAARLRQRLAGPCERGLVEKSGPESWRITALGRRFLNDLQAEFLPD